MQNCSAQGLPLVPRRSPHLLLTAMLLFGSAVVLDAKTLTVTNGHDHGPGSLRSAIVRAADGDVISFAEGFSVVNVTSSALAISQKHLTIKGPGANRLTVRRKVIAGKSQVFTVFEIKDAKVAVSGLRISNGSVDHFGGGVYSFNSTVTLSNCVISHNKGTGGGGILNGGDGTMTINGCTVSDNGVTPSSFGDGGGLYNTGTVTITKSTFARNSAPGSGGAIVNNGSVTITSSTVARNSASGTGGGIYNAPGSDSSPHVVKARNTIIASNTDGLGSPDFSGPLNSLGYNLIGNANGTSISGNTTGNQLNVDPLLGPLQDNDGTTLTMGLGSGSPALDQGHSGTAAKDQRGLSRPVDDPNLPNANGGNGSDIGAFELQADEITAAPEAAE